MDDKAFNHELVCLISQDGLSCEDVERQLAQVLVSHGYAKNSFIDAIVEREHNYPTALEMGEFNAAIPHCDVEHVNTPALCMGVLPHSVEWHRMDDPSATCKVSLVVMLALTEPHAHLEMLQKVIKLLQDQQLVKRIVQSSSSQEAYDLAQESLR